jgi:hypothetical protein
MGQRLFAAALFCQFVSLRSVSVWFARLKLGLPLPPLLALASLAFNRMRNRAPTMLAVKVSRCMWNEESDKGQGVYSVHCTLRGRQGTDVLRVRGPFSQRGSRLENLGG